MSDITVYGTAEWQEKLAELTPREVARAIRRGIGRGLRKHKKLAVSGFKSTLPAASKRNPKYNDRLVDAIRLGKAGRNAEGVLYGSLHTMGTKKKGSGTYRARFFEQGTKERYQKSINGKQLKTPRRLGKISQSKFQFFNNATNGMQETVSSEISKSIIEQINKLNNS